MKNFGNNLAARYNRTYRSKVRKIGFKFKQSYSGFQTKYLSWFMGFGQTAAKTQSAIYKVQSFNAYVYPAMPAAGSYILIGLRAISAMLVTGKGTFDRMRVPNIDYLYSPEDQTENYYDLWVAYNKKQAELNGAYNDYLSLLHLIFEFYIQKKFNDEETLKEFVAALRLYYPKLVDQIIVEQLTHSETALVDRISPVEDRLKIMIDSKQHFLISIGEFRLQLNLAAETLPTNKPTRCDIQVNTTNKKEQEESETEREAYSSWYRFYTQLTDDLAENDDYCASITLHFSPQDKINSILNDKEYFFEKQKNIVLDVETSVDAEGGIQKYKKTIFELIDEWQQTQLLAVDVNEANEQERRKELTAQYNHVRQAIYKYHLALLYERDRKHFTKCVKLLKKKLETETQYINTLQSLETDKNVILNALDVQRSNLRKHLSNNYAGKYEKFLGGSFTTHISNTNVLVFTVYSGYSMFVVASAIPPLAIVCAILIAAVTFYVSLSYGKNGILSTYAKLGRAIDWWNYQDEDKPLKPLWKSAAFNITVALASIVTSPLLYISILSPVTQMLLAFGFAASLASPLGIFICAGLVIVATIASLGVACSQGAKITETFRKHLGPNSVLYKKAKKENLRGIYFAAVFFAVIAAAASISISVVGDIFGINKLIKTSNDLLILPAVLSFIANAAQDFADVTSNFLKLAFSIYKKPQAMKSETVNVTKPAIQSQIDTPTPEKPQDPPSESNKKEKIPKPSTQSLPKKNDKGASKGKSSFFGEGSRFTAFSQSNIKVEATIDNSNKNPDSTFVLN